MMNISTDLSVLYHEVQLVVRSERRSVLMVQIVNLGQTTQLVASSRTRQDRINRNKTAAKTQHRILYFPISARIDGNQGFSWNDG